MKTLYARCYWGWKTRTWPWRVPASVVVLSRTPPSEHDLGYFRKLHGLDDKP